MTTEPDGQFTTVFGRGLVEELPLILPRPYLVVTMADLWPRFKTSLAGSALAEGAGSTGRVATPAQLSSDLTRLADADPTHYAAVAQALTALLSQA